MVYLDNAYTGYNTPCNLNNVAAGEHTVMLRLSGYQDTYSRVVVNSGQVSQLTLGMAPGSNTPSPTVPTTGSPGFGALIAVLALAGTMAVMAVCNRR